MTHIHLQTSETENTDHREENSVNRSEDQKNSSEESKAVTDSEIATNADHGEHHSSEHPRKLREFDRQIEKERLAKLFENSPHAVGWSCRKKRESQSGRRRKNFNYDFQTENKENLPLDTVSAVENY